MRRDNWQWKGIKKAPSPWVWDIPMRDGFPITMEAKSIDEQLHRLSSLDLAQCTAALASPATKKKVMPHVRDRIALLQKEAQ